MDAFLWNDFFVTGLSVVDKQHQQLVKIINHFGELVMRDEAVTQTELDKVFAELANYAQYHFKEEEALMATKGLTPKYIQHHQQDHLKFVEEITQLYQGMSVDNRDSAKRLLQFLTNWLAYHILGTDQFMAQQMALIASGGPLENTEAPTKTPAMEALLLALNTLFQQVSERNHELVELNKTLEARVQERTQALLNANQQLDDIANTDTLTNLPNRRYALRNFALAWDEAARQDTALACMMIDADGFKRINDTQGHDAGDVVLRALSKQLRDAIRTDDIACRLGGDEFLIICLNTNMDGALKLAEKIRAEVASLRVAAGTGEWCGSVSIGVAARAPEMQNMDDLLKAADLGVYAAKRKGRNCVAVAD